MEKRAQILDRENSLNPLLQAGFDFGSRFLESELFGSVRADERALQQERDYYNRLNGSGPVNSRAANQAPKSWTEFFFGQRSNARDATAGQTGSPWMGPPVFLLAGLVALAALFFFFRK